MIQGISILFIAAAIQGFFLAATLGIHRKNIQANHILAVWIAILSLDLLQQVYYLEAYYRSFPQFILLINLLPLTYGGFLFLYVRSFLASSRLHLKDIFHFLFFFIGLSIQIPQLVLSPSEKLQQIDQLLIGNIPWQLQFFSLLLPITASIYAVTSYRLFLKHPAAQNASLSWLKFMLRLNILIWIVVWLSFLIPKETQVISTIIYLLVSLVIYALGYFSLRQPQIFIQGDFSSKENGPKYGENRLPDDLRESIWVELETYMQTQTPWRSANLTLAQLANDTGIASHHISQVLNDHLGSSFNDYLNQYRVNAVCAELAGSPLNILEIALACGFSSKSGFNATFKKHTGKTPSEYRKSIEN